jgi:hypothetical protein
MTESGVFTIAADMSTSPKPNLSWRQLYATAMLELDVQFLPNRIDAAKNAINTRITELDSAGPTDEREQLVDAQRTLNSLLRIYKGCQ